MICASVHPKPPGRQLFSVLEEVCAHPVQRCVCAEWRCLVGLRTSADSRTGLWPLGAVSTGLHTGERTGARAWSPLLPLPAGGAPRQQRSQGGLRVSAREEPPHPGRPGPQSLASSGLPPRVPLPKDPGPRSSPRLHGPALPCPDAVTVHMVDRIHFI